MKKFNTLTALADVGQRHTSKESNDEALDSGAANTVEIPAENTGEELGEAHDAQIMVIQEEVLSGDIETVDAIDHLLEDVKPEDAKPVEFAEERIQAIATRYGMTIQSYSNESHFGVPALDQTRGDFARQQAQALSAQLKKAHEGLQKRIAARAK